MEAIFGSTTQPNPSFWEIRAVNIWHKTGSEMQNFSERSYIGGVPMLPNGESVPVFSKTGREMTFFFQIKFPDDHKWRGHIVSVFMVTDYADADTYLPDLPSPLRAASLNREFFSNYQTFFRIFIFEEGDASFCNSYTQVLAFHELHTSVPAQGASVAFARIHDRPEWILDDEAPDNYEGDVKAVTFLFQTRIDYDFKKVPGAPRQQVENTIAGGTGFVDKFSDNYNLFVANELYFFGINDGDDRHIYIVPQS